MGINNPEKYYQLNHIISTALTESPVHQEMEIMRKQLDRLEKLLLESRNKPA